MKITKKIITSFRILLLALIIYFTFKEYRYNKYVSYVECVAVEKVCKYGRGGSYVKFGCDSKSYRLELYGEPCFNLVIGSNVKLRYDNFFDEIYFDGNSMNQKYIFGLILFFILTFTPAVLKYKK